MPHHNNQSINTPLGSLTISRRSYKEMLADFKKMQILAADIRQMYVLLDNKHHELTYVTMRMEKHFSELFQSVHGNQFALKHDFKGTIESICFEKEQVEKILTKTFFR